MTGGFYIDPSPNSIYISPVLGCLLHFLYDLVPNIQWYAVMICLVYFAAFWGVSRSLRRVVLDPELRFATQLLIAALFLLVIQRVSFTAASSIAAGAGWVMIVVDLLAAPASSLSLPAQRASNCLIFLLLTTAFLLRFPAAVVVSACGAVSAFVIIVFSSREYSSTSKLRGAVVMKWLARGGLPLVAAIVAHYAVWHCSTDMSRLCRQFDLAGKIDYTTAAGVNWAKLSDKLGINERALRMINRHFFSDPDFRDPFAISAKLKVLASVDDEPSNWGVSAIFGLARRSNNIFRGMLADCDLQSYFLSIISLVVIVFFFGTPRTAAGVLLLCTAPVALLALVGALVKPVPLRMVCGPLSVGVFLSVALVCRQNLRRLPKVIVFLVVVALSLRIGSEAADISCEQFCNIRAFQEESNSISRCITEIGCPVLVSHLPARSIPVMANSYELMSNLGIPFYFSAHLPVAEIARERMGFKSSFDWIGSGRAIAILTPADGQLTLRDFLAYWECFVGDRLNVRRTHSGKIWELFYVRLNN